VGNQEPGNAVILYNISSAVESRSVGNTPDHECNTDVGHDDGIALGLGEEDRVRVEVVGPLGVSLLAGNVED
jgi:hypothetical protein